MKQITAQQFANIFGMYVAKDKGDGLVFVYEHKPILYFGKSTWFLSSGICRRITELISDADSIDWNVLIEPQEEHAELPPVPFDENYAPEGYKAVKMNHTTCINCHFYLNDLDCDIDKGDCTPASRPDRTDVYFVKKEE